MKTALIASLAAGGGAVVALGAFAALHAAQPAGAAGPPGYLATAGVASSQAGGGVTLAQFQAHMHHRLMKADTDHDGRISLAEWTAWRTAHPGHGGGRDPSRGFARMDANHDGFVTPDEIDAVAARRFARMDTNHDGLLTPEERAAARHGGGADDGGVQPLDPR